ncbi:radical SAM protein [Flavobacterium psychrophilum]|uniref:radical SAM/SPASM domain-containing protein n=2 Tax=Flavobacterium psychrophilum TaxID=96345 RepID=UPI0006187C9D|nr:radical SAM protein [Flavobacterium psychrophilum]EKT3958586.1 radical SAM protein [Flavobacterium psychrophilum]EKT4510551.1 radical SAM protein [Flavobacterium psychrophilum]EKT4518309.1 radical SAM protein [Flavobacterium psychrophilum]EKT4550712.1 radical SAM protein [Flavobacterium psychrophilum]ELM3645049.1 radical SAM protein [Flavobacterium psychrophilum]
MKYSQFNNFFNYEDKKIGYNAFSNEFTLLDPELFELLDAAIRESNFEELNKLHPDFFTHLVEKGFLVDTEIDEIQNVKDLVRKIDSENEVSYKLIINPTMNCNFKCWYCYETHIKASKMSENTIISITKFVDNLLIEKENLEYFNLSWFGGEPLLYFDKTVLPLLQNIYPKMIDRKINFTSEFTTNGLLINQKMLNLCKEFGVNDFQITLDGHRERHNQVRYISKEKGSYDEIVSNIILCLKNKLSVRVRLNVSEETIETLPKIIDDFINITKTEKKYLSFSFHEVWQEKKDIHSDIQFIVDLFREREFNTLYKGVNQDTVRSSCYADKRNHATLNYNGDVFKCTARDFESKSKEGYLNEEGIIEWNEKFEDRMDSKFKNPPCLKCSILPICNGGCSQQAIEHKGIEYCVYNFDENRKLDIIKDKFSYAIS